MTRKMRDLKASILISVQITMLPVTVRGAGVQGGGCSLSVGKKFSVESEEFDTC
jgi:hypothetical protein